MKKKVLWSLEWAGNARQAPPFLRGFSLRKGERRWIDWGRPRRCSLQR